MKRIIDEKFGVSYVPDCADEYLELIYDIGVGYDGYNDVENLKGLIDEMMDFASKARKCLKEGKIFSNTPLDKLKIMCYNTNTSKEQSKINEGDEL